MVKILTPGIWIMLLGLGGLMGVLIENPKYIGGKIPFALFFLLIMIIGIYIHVRMGNEIGEETYGEFGEGRGFG